MSRCGRSLLLVAVLTLMAAPALADPERPASWLAGPGVAEVTEQRLLPPLDGAKLAAEDAVAEAFGQPPRFAMPFEIAESPAKSGGWTDFGDKVVWRLRVQAPDAVSLNFGFHNVRLVEGARLWIYAADAAGKGEFDRERVLGPYGPAINEKHGEFWTPVLAAGDAIIELEVPAERRNEVSLELARVNQGYRGFGRVIEAYRQPAAAGEGKRESDCDKSDGGARSGSCNMDVACLAPDDPWNQPRRSVARYTLEGQFLCTGSLVNNTANDRRMLFATASHCGVEPGNSSTIVAYWNYEWPSCRTPGSSASSQVNPPDSSQTSSGAVYLAGTRDPFSSETCTNPDDCSDFALVEFDDSADPSLDLYWAGWDRRVTPASCGPQGAADSTEGLCASIHHPSGDEKRITFVDSDLLQGSISFAQGVHWHAFWHPDPPVLPGISEPRPPSIPPGVTEPGSSGSTLYSANQRLVGVLSGGPAFCGATGANLSDFYGQLAHAWNGLGTASTRMRDYLDPVGSNPQFIDGIGAAPFRVEYEEGFVEACSSDGAVEIAIGIDGDPGFSAPVNLAATGLPSGANASFSPNPATPGSSTLTVGNLAGAAIGPATIVVEGLSGGSSGSAVVPFHLGNALPASAGPALPSDAATVETPQVELSWTGVGQAAGYRVEVATDFAFTDVVVDQVVRGASAVSVPLASRTQYFWRVTAQNGCGTAEPSATRSFITAPQAGECPIGQQSTEFWSDDMESGPNGWTLGAGSVQNTWAQITSDSVSGTTSWNAINVASISDQRLVSPPIELPSGDSLTLRFQNRQQMEDAAAGCFDGAVLEISTDDGSTWAELTGPRIGFRPQDGPIDAGFGNPLAGSPAWCGDPRGWENYAIDLSDFAGQTVRLRYRVATDSSVGGRDGWLVDDVRVLGCGGVTPKAPLSGNWYNPARDGEGCQLTREANGSTYILTCYVYQDGDQVWMIGAGSVDDGAFVSTGMVITEGAQYGSAFDPDDVTRIPFGSVAMEFDDCNTADVIMDPVAPGFENVVLPMQKIVPVDCAAGIPDPANAVRAGNWYNPDRDGEGFQLAVEGSDGLHVITFYTFMDGEPIWLIGAGTIDGDTIEFADTVITSGTGFGSNFDPADVVRTSFGSLTLTFDDCNNATIIVDSDLPEFEDQTIALTRIVQGQCP